MTLRLAFMGSPEFAVPTLEALLAAGHDVACVYSQPPRPAGRGKQLRKTAVHEPRRAPRHRSAHAGEFPRRRPTARHSRR